MSLHRYLYANACPISISDPTGEFGLVELGAMMGIFNNLIVGYTARTVVQGPKETALEQFVDAMGNYLTGCWNISDFRFGKNVFSFLLTLYAGEKTLYSVNTDLPYLGKGELIFGVAGGDAKYRVFLTGGSVNLFKEANPIRFAIWKGILPIITDAKIDRICIGGDGVLVTYSGASGGAALFGLSSGTVSLSKKTISK